MHISAVLFAALSGMLRMLDMQSRAKPTDLNLRRISVVVKTDMHVELSGCHVG